RRYFGGTQDNGVILGSDEDGVDGWSIILGGDGGYSAVDPENPNILYTETQWVDIHKSTDGGRSFTPATTGITEPWSNFLFITPLTMDPSNARRLWTGGGSLWRTTNGAASWTQASAPLSTTAQVSAIAVAPSDPDRVVVGLSDGTIHRSDQALHTGASSEWPASRARAGGWVSYLAFDPDDADVVYATYTTFGGKHVFTSTDGGASWQQIDGNGPRRLPNIPVHSIVVDPTDPRRLYVGTDLGVFVSTTGGRRWAVESTGFAHAVTESLAIVTRPNGRAWLFAFTHGRGAWRVELGK
ncbi:MAG: hypothetical protein GY856_09070, partial [bacterium]|nr:hypothetical protein [bacterium]